MEYFGSQPWPFGMELMLGFIAYANSNTIRVDNRELEDAQWISREQVREGLAEARDVSSFYSSTKWRLPPATAIANRLVAAWAYQCT